MRRTADQVYRLLERYGFSNLQYKMAQTGTYYVSGQRPDNGDPFSVRVSNHADAYATSTYSIDPYEGTYAGLLALLARAFGPKPRTPAAKKYYGVVVDGVVKAKFASSASAFRAARERGGRAVRIVPEGEGSTRAPGEFWYL